MNVIKSNNGETIEIESDDDFHWYIDRKDAGWTREAFLDHYRVGSWVTLFGKVIAQGPIRACRMNETGCCS